MKLAGSAKQCMVCKSVVTLDKLVPATEIRKKVLEYQKSITPTNNKDTVIETQITIKTEKELPATIAQDNAKLIKEIQIPNQAKKELQIVVNENYQYDGYAGEAAKANQITIET